VTRRGGAAAALGAVLGVALLIGLAVAGYAYFTAARALHVNHVAVGSAPPGADSVMFAGDAQATLAAWWLPAQRCRRSPCAAPGSAVVLIHGLNSSREGMRDRIRLYQQAGFAILAYDQRGQGDSTGHNSAGQSEMVDAQRAVAFAATQPGVDAARIGVDGLSFGGMVTVLAAAADQQIAAVVVESPASSALALAGGGWIGRLGLRLHGVDPGPLDATAAAAALTDRPVRVVVGQQEYPGTARAIAANAHGSLWIAPGAHTEAPSADPRGYRLRVIDFMVRALG
jgi:uncharacterized protein